MLQFAHKEYLWLLLAVIPVTLFFILFIRWRKKRIAKFGTTSLVLQLIPDFSNGKQYTKFFLLLFAYSFLILGFANPQIGTKEEKVKRAGIDVMIALDVSNSMMSTDVQPSRLARAKNFISKFIDQLKNDRLGMIVFAGNAYMQMPLTTDYSAGRMYLATVNTNMLPTQGTNIAEAINLAKEGFVKGEKGHKALIIITDGEDHEGSVDEAVNDATGDGIKIFTVGIGSQNGSPIPEGGDYKSDEDGNIVLSKLDETMLRDIASKGNGKFYRLGSGEDEVTDILKQLGKVGAKDFEETIFTDFDDQFQWCLAIAAVLLFAEWWLSERKSKLSFNFLK
ncbi:MAG: VWA domain-containing protein [Bacteroidota bacterium]